MTAVLKTADQYLATLPDERRAALQAVRTVILDNLNPGFEEGIQYGMLGYYVPHELYPRGYHANPKVPLPFINLGSQKSHMALYLMCLYAETELERWFHLAWAQTGKKLDMGKSCVRFKRLDDLPLDVIEELVRRIRVQDHVTAYETSLGSARPKPTKTLGSSPKSRTKSPPTGPTPRLSQSASSHASAAKPSSVKKKRPVGASKTKTSAKKVSKR